MHRPTQTTFQSTSLSRYASFTQNGGQCGEMRGIVRVKVKNAAWHNHEFFAQFCDYGEPGRGRDTFKFEILGDTHGHGNTSTERLTGGNIQAH